MMRDVEFVGGPVDGRVKSFDVGSPLMAHGWRLGIPIQLPLRPIEFVGEEEAKLSIGRSGFAHAVYRVVLGDYHNSPITAHFEEVTE